MVYISQEYVFETSVPIYIALRHNERSDYMKNIMVGSPRKYAYI